MLNDPPVEWEEIVALRAEIARLREALQDLLDAATSRVPGDDALWEDAIDDAREALGPKGEGEDG